MGRAGPEIPHSPLGCRERAPCIHWEEMRLPGGWEGNLLWGWQGPPSPFLLPPPHCILLGMEDA